MKASELCEQDLSESDYFQQIHSGLVEWYRFFFFLYSSTTAQGMDRGSENVDLSLSQLLDQLGESSLPDTTMTSLSQNVQQKQSKLPG